MSTEQTLLNRSNSACELCSSTNNIQLYPVSPHTQVTVDDAAVICETCQSQIEDPDTLVVNHWRCLNDSMWNQVPAVQVLAWRQLHHLVSKGEGWAQDLLDMMYLEEEVQKWAETGFGDEEDKPLDVNGVELKKGDDVTVIKDLPIKGSSQVIKQGTVVRGIGLTDDPKHIQGRANGQAMYIIAEYCRKK
ncbi:PhnA domain-containing protein [Vibrio sp.]|nr:PhnA domain-containing protein [Vibrio sp.]